MYKLIPVMMLPLVMMACHQKPVAHPDKPATVRAAKTKSDSTVHSQSAVTAMAVIDQQKHYTAIEDLVPDGYSILELEEGDLNRDSCKDAVVILARNGEEEEEKAPKRPTLLLLGQPDHTYKITARSDKSVMSAMAGGMEGEALKGIVIKEGYFSFEYFGRMPGGVEWEYTVTFKYDRMDSGHWFLHRDGLTVYRDLKPVSNKMKTTKDFGKVFFEQFDVDKDFESMIR